jgi:hypothetical protein
MSRVRIWTIDKIYLRAKMLEAFLLFVRFSILRFKRAVLKAWCLSWDVQNCSVSASDVIHLGMEKRRLSVAKKCCPFLVGKFPYRVTDRLKCLRGSRVSRGPRVWGPSRVVYIHVFQCRVCVCCDSGPSTKATEIGLYIRRLKTRVFTRNADMSIVLRGSIKFSHYTWYAVSNVPVLSVKFEIPAT